MRIAEGTATRHIALPREDARPLDLHDHDIGRLFVGQAPEKGWLVEGRIPLRKASSLIESDHRSLSLLATKLAIAVASSPGGKGSQMWKGRQVTAHGRAVLLFGHTDRDEVHRCIHELDPTGEKRRQCNGRLFAAPCDEAPSVRKLLDFGADGLIELTEWAAQLRRKLVGIKDLKLIVFSPLPALLPVNWADPAVFRLASNFMARLASQTGAAILGGFDAFEYRLLETGAHQCR